jgi:hypothetical protein
VDYPLAQDPVRPWRTTALVASAVAALELVVLVGTGVALLGKPLAEHAKTAAIERLTQKPVVAAKVVRAPQEAVAKLARGETTVFVLNGNGQAGAAATEAAEVRAHGYVVGGTGNASRHDYPRSVVMYRPGYEGEARRLARDLGIKAVGPLDGLAARELQGAHVALLLGNR